MKSQILRIKSQQEICNNFLKEIEAEQKTIEESLSKTLQEKILVFKDFEQRHQEENNKESYDLRFQKKKMINI